MRFRLKEEIKSDNARIEGEFLTMLTPFFTVSFEYLKKKSNPTKKKGSEHG